MTNQPSEIEEAIERHISQGRLITPDEVVIISAARQAEVLRKILKKIIVACELGGSELAIDDYNAACKALAEAEKIG